MDPQSGARAQMDFDRAQYELDQGNTLAALAAMEKALAVWDDPHWYSRLGFCIAKERGHLTRAFELCRSAIAREPGNPLHYLYLSKIHLIAADQYQALQALRQGMSQGGGTQEIRQMLDSMGIRKSPVIPFLSRQNRLNKYLGKILSRLGLR